jgi:hypothetical protein
LIAFSEQILTRSRAVCDYGATVSFQFYLGVRSDKEVYRTVLIHFHNREDRQCNGCRRRTVIVDLLSTQSGA